MENPKVGTAVFVLKEGKVLFGKREGSHGSGTWSVPGGHLEFGETFEECISRETKEECGLEISNVRFANITNDIFKKENKHYVTLFFFADAQGEPEDQEGEKMHSWQWFDTQELPEPLFLPIENLLKQGFEFP